MDSYSVTYSAPFGHLGIRIDQGRLSCVDFIDDQSQAQDSIGNLEVIHQLDNYFSNPQFQFNLPLVIEGTAFQKRVWKALTRIPVGETRSYGQLAKELKSSARAIGNACRHNPLPLVIPCHRVVSINGIGGFSGDTDGYKLKIKRWLLQHEGVVI